METERHIVLLSWKRISVFFTLRASSKWHISFVVRGSHQIAASLPIDTALLYHFELVKYPGLAALFYNINFFPGKGGAALAALYDIA